MKGSWSPPVRVCGAGPQLSGMLLAPGLQPWGGGVPAGWGAAGLCPFPLSLAMSVSPQPRVVPLSSMYSHHNKAVWGQVAPATGDTGVGGAVLGGAPTAKTQPPPEQGRVGTVPSWGHSAKSIMAQGTPALVSLSPAPRGPQLGEPHALPGAQDLASWVVYCCWQSVFLFSSQNQPGDGSSPEPAPPWP